ncbi:CinA family protein [Sphingobacterium kitahiroshimense]|uniref:CinA family protein n=1 Tax=Sphingobacterium kitahiroshimense TaxID=470446 RepID=UPI0032084B02
MMEYIDTTTLDKVGQFLKDNQLKVFIGESMTGGFLGSVLSMQMDSGSYFLGGVTSYATSVKQSLLQVDEHSISYFTPESSEVTFEMLEGLKKLVEADVYIAITGMAFPDSSTEHQAEVGDIFIAICFSGIHMRKTLHCVDCDAAQIYIAAVNHIIHELYRFTIDLDD